MIETVLRKRVAFVKSKKESMIDFRNFEMYLYLFSVLAVISGIILPYLGFSFFSIVLFKYFFEIHDEYLSGIKRYYYDIMLQPLMSPSHYLQIGYEVREDSEELQKHLAVMQMDDKSRRKELARLGKVVKKNEPERIVGFSKDVLTRHAWILGATGAGKTSLLMTAFHHLFKVGAGVVFVDGKSDAKMFNKFYSLASDAGRDTDVFVINTLKPEKTAFDTNTFSPIASLPPSAQVEFLASVASSGGGGDMKYWEGRGKALLAPVVFTLAFRKQFYGEDYSYETVSNALTAKEFSFLTAVLYVISLEQEEMLLKDEKIHSMLMKAKQIIIPKSQDVASFESLVSYCIQFPQKAAELEKFGYSKAFLESLYKCFSSAYNTYLSSLSSEWSGAVRQVAHELREFLKEKGYSPFDMPITEWRKVFFEYAEFSTNSSKNERIGRRKKASIEILLQPPEKDVTQHQYAQQQWTTLFTSFDKFSHIFGSLDPDIDMVDILRNNRLLYVLIPPLEQDSSTTEILGKSIVIAIKSAASVALGGKLEGLTNTQQDIVSAIITPIPLGMVVLDEYGAYPVPGIDVITAQVRSINISFWISTQDYTSARVGGTDENSAKKIWGNTITKVFMKLEDVEAKQKLMEAVTKRLVATVSSATKLDDKNESVSHDVSLQSEEVFDPKVTTKFKDGFSLIVSDGVPAYVQIFWADQKPIDRLFVNRFEKI